MWNDRKPRTEQRWRDIIKDCQESGQFIRSYCLRRGISEGTFHYWRKKLPHQSEPKLNQFIAITFVHLRLLKPASFCIMLHFHRVIWYSSQTQPEPQYKLIQSFKKRAWQKVSSRESSS